MPEKHVIDELVHKQLHLAVATLKDGTHKVLYLGTSATAAEKAAVFDAEKHVEIQVFRAPQPYRRFNAVQTAIINHTPLQPGMTMDDLHRIHGTKPGTVPPDGWLETEEIKRRMASLSSSTSGGVPVVVTNRETALEKLSDDELKEAAVKSGLSVEGFQPILDGEEREDLILGILEKEFPVVPFYEIPVKPVANKLQGLG